MLWVCVCLWVEHISQGSREESITYRTSYWLAHTTGLGKIQTAEERKKASKFSLKGRTTYEWNSHTHHVISMLQCTKKWEKYANKIILFDFCIMSTIKKKTALKKSVFNNIEIFQNVVIGMFHFFSFIEKHSIFLFYFERPSPTLCI